MIKLSTENTFDGLFGQSKWWGEPDMPETLCYPEVSVTDEDGETYDDPLTFICQLRCDELAPFDTQGLLPRQGMLWFFAALDYFLGNIDTPSYPGMGVWQRQHFRVLYAEDISTLHTQQKTCAMCAYSCRQLSDEQMCCLKYVRSPFGIKYWGLIAVLFTPTTKLRFHKLHFGIPTAVSPAIEKIILRAICEDLFCKSQLVRSHLVK